MRLINADVIKYDGCVVDGSHSAKEALKLMEKEEYRQARWMTEEEVLELLRNAPVIDATLNRHAMWERIVDDEEEDETVWRCSHCGNEQITDFGDKCHKYCEECGCVMDNGAEYQSDDCLFTDPRDTYWYIRQERWRAKLEAKDESVQM